MFVPVIPCLKVTSLSLADLPHGCKEQPVRQNEATASQKKDVVSCILITD